MNKSQTAEHGGSCKEYAINVSGELATPFVAKTQTSDDTTTNHTQQCNYMPWLMLGASILLLAAAAYAAHTYASTNTKISESWHYSPNFGCQPLQKTPCLTNTLPPTIIPDSQTISPYSNATLENSHLYFDYVLKFSGRMSLGCLQAHFKIGDIVFHMMHTLSQPTYKIMARRWAIGELFSQSTLFAQQSLLGNCQVMLEAIASNLPESKSYKLFTSVFKVS